MRTSDKRFIELSRRNTQQPTVRVTLDMTSGNIVLGSADIQSVTVTRSINGGSFCTGGTESASMELKVFASSMPAVPETAAYIVELGYVDDDGTAHWADFGTFATNTENVVRDGLWMTVTGYDAFYWMDAEGYDFGTASGKTALSTRSMMASIAKGTSIEYTASEWSDSNLWLYRPSGTKREQIGQLAAANCANAVMSGADKVTLRVPTETGIALTPNDYAVGGFSVTAETALPVSKVKATFKRTYDYDSSSDYSRQGDESVECSYPETSNGLAIELDESLFADGEFADETLLQKAKNDLSVIASAGAKNGGLGASFRGFDATLFGCCFLEPLDILTVTDHYGDTHTVCVLSASWAYDGGIKTTLSASASAEDTSASSSSNSVSKIASQLETVQGGVLALQRLTVDTLRGDNATFNSVIADKLTATDAKITNLLADKADIDLLNVNNGWIENGVIKEGAITNATIHDGAITTAKITDASITAEKVHDLNADSITTGKLKTQYIILTDDDGETQSVISALNAKAESSEGGVLDGAIVQDESIEAAKISVADLKAFEATIGSFDIDDTSIHNGKSFIDDPTPGVYVGTTGIGVGDGSYSGGGIQDGKAYYTDDNGAYLSTTDYATYSEDSDGGIAVLADEYSGWVGSTAAVYGVKSCPFEVYADGTVKIKGTNGSIEFDAVSGELDINATKLSIQSSTVATESGVEDSVGDMKEQIVGSDGTGGIVQQQIKSFDSDLTQANVFNRLTNNGAAQGIYLENGNLYVNGTYVKTGTLNADLVRTGTIADKNSLNYWNLDTGDFRLSSNASYGTTGKTVEQEISAVAESKASAATSAYDKTLTQKTVFDRLTNNGEDQGLYMEGGKLYVNGTYIKTGTLNADLITTGALTVKKNGTTVFQADVEDGSVYIGGATVNIGDSTTLNSTLNAVSGKYGYCYTNDATAAKTVSISDFQLKKGSAVTVRFSYANTADNPTLNVNNTGAKAIAYAGYSYLPSKYNWASLDVLTFVYDGSYWQLSDSGSKKNARANWANDASTVSVAAGQVTFDSGTFILNSNNMTVSSSGIVTANQFKANGSFTGGTTTGRGYGMQLTTGGKLTGYMNGSQYGYIDCSATAEDVNNTSIKYHGIQLQGNGIVRLSTPRFSTAASSNTSVTTTTGFTGTISQPIISELHNNGGGSVGWHYGTMELIFINGLLTGYTTVRTTG